jgi:hypothetical protein
MTSLDDIIAYLVDLWLEIDIGKLLQESLIAGSVDLFDRRKDQIGNLPDAKPDESGPVFLVLRRHPNSGILRTQMWLQVSEFAGSGMVRIFTWRGNRHALTLDEL